LSRKPYIPGLDELAFFNRNKAYGAYRLRKRYPRYLVISTLTAILVYLLLSIYPFIFEMVEPAPLVLEDYLLEVDYTILPPPEEELPDLPEAQSPEQAPVVPVVSDSVKPEEERRVIPPEKEPEPAPKDSTGKGGSGNGDGTGTGDALTAQIDVYPRFPGGDEARHFFLRRNIRYPEEALRKVIQGTVIVVFVVETSGEISNVSISKSIGGGCDEEAMRVVRAMPRWEPGKRGGQPVRVMLRMPVVFRIPGKPGT